MLKSLSIKNYALINHLELDFSNGFTVLTGETGAGKSILLGALELILGSRADMSSIGNNEEKCIVEGVFDIDGLELNTFFTQNNLDYESEIAIRRILLPNGKSRAFINEIPVNLTLLKKLSSFLIDIHSQHENLLIKDQNFQISVIDSFAQNSELLQKYQKEFQIYRKEKKEYEILVEKNEKEKSNLDFYTHQLEKFEILDLENLDLENLEQEFELMTNSSVIQQNFDELNHYLDGDEIGVLGNLQKILGNLSDIQKHLPLSEKLVKRVNDLIIELSDINDEVKNLENSIVTDPQKLEYLQSQMALIYQLFEVFRVQKIGELLLKKQELEEKIENIIGFDEKIKNKKSNLEKQKKELNEYASKLTKTRKTVFSKLEQEILSILNNLGMPYAQFKIEHKICSKINLQGQDEISFLFSANLGQSSQEISKSASGGEISRIMFALKSLLSRFSNLPTIIFDEIDTGISGAIAEKMGKLMKEMGKVRQVLSITHLPQIAAMGDGHFLVEKEHLLGTTTTNICKISKKERVSEIAQMLSGKDIGKDALKHAEKMINK